MKLPGRPVHAGMIVGFINGDVPEPGRSPVTIHRLFFTTRTSTQKSVQVTENSPTPKPPVTLEARGQAVWHIGPRMLGVMTKQRGNPMVVRPVVEYGPGDQARGRRLWIGVPQNHLPGGAPRFKPNCLYRLRTLGPPRHGMRRSVEQAFDPVLGVDEPMEEMP